MIDPPLAPPETRRRYVVPAVCLFGVVALLGAGVHKSSSSPALFKAEAPAVGAMCAGLTGDSLLGCRAVHRPGKRERYLTLMAACDWQPESNIDAILQPEGFGSDKTFLTLGRAETLEWGLSHPHLKSPTESCVIETEQGDWLLLKDGPLESYGASTRDSPDGTTPSQSWDGLLSVFHEELIARWRQPDGSLWISNHVLGSIDASGDLIGMPPLHQHHYHLWYDGHLGRMEFNNHGDSDCTEELEGVYCQMMEHPPHLGFRLTGKVGAWAVVNDVREVGAPGLTSWYLTGMMFPKQQQQRPLKQYIVDLTPTYWKISRGQMPWPVDYSQDRVMWTTRQLDRVDEVVYAYFHFHRPAIDEVYVLEGDGATYGLDQPPWASGFQAWSDTLVGTDAVAPLRASIEAQLARGDGRLLCRSGREPNFLDFRRAWCSFGGGGASQLSGAAAAATGDMKITLVSFFTVREPEKPSRMLRMHLILRVFTTLRNDTELDAPLYTQILPPAAEAVPVFEGTVGRVAIWTDDAWDTNWMETVYGPTFEAVESI